MLKPTERKQCGEVGKQVSLGGLGPSTVVKVQIDGFERAKQLIQDLEAAHRRLKNWGELVDLQTLERWQREVSSLLNEF